MAVTTEKIILDIRSELDKARKDIKGLKSGVSKVNKEIEKTESTLKKAGTAFVAFMSVQAIKGFAQKIIEVRGEFERLETVLRVTLGSARAARKEFEMIKEFAAKTPFGVLELTNSFVKLTNFGLKPSREEMRKLGDIAAALGKTFDQLAEAIIDATTGEFERLKEFGIRAKKMGDTVTFTFKEISTQVDFTSSAIREYITSLGDLEGVTGGMAAISETLTGKISNLEDAIDSLLNTIGEEGAPAVKKFLDAFIGLIGQTEEEIKQRSAMRKALGPIWRVMFGGPAEREDAKRDLEVAVMDIGKAAAGKLLRIMETFGLEKFIGLEKKRLEDLIKWEPPWLEPEAEEDKKPGVKEKKLDKRQKALLKKWEDENKKALSKELKMRELQAEDLSDIELANVKKAAEDKIAIAEATEQVITDMIQEEIDEREAIHQAAAQVEKVIAANVFDAVSGLMKEGSEEFKAMQIIATTIDTYAAAVAAYKSTAAIPAVGPFAAPAAAAAAIIFGLAQVARIASMQFAEGGFTGKGKWVDQKGKRIAGIVHEDEFVFNQEKTAVLRPFFEDIHHDRIDIRGLAALTRRGVMTPIVNNKLNADILEKEVRKIYQKMSEETDNSSETPFNGGIMKRRGSVTTIIK